MQHFHVSFQKTRKNPKVWGKRGGGGGVEKLLLFVIPRKQEHNAFIFAQSRYDITMLSRACLSNFNNMDFFFHIFNKRKSITLLFTIQEIKSQENTKTKTKNDMCNLLPHFFTKQRKTRNNIHRFMYIYISSLHYTIWF